MFVGQHSHPKWSNYWGSRHPRRGVSTGLPTQAIHRHHVWTWDFIFDRTDKGGTLKMMTLLDEYTRQSLAIQVERQLTATQVLAVLESGVTPNSCSTLDVSVS